MRTLQCSYIENIVMFSCAHMCAHTHEYVYAYRYVNLSIRASGWVHKPNVELISCCSENSDLIVMAKSVIYKYAKHRGAMDTAPANRYNPISARVQLHTLCSPCAKMVSREDFSTIYLISKVDF